MRSGPRFEALQREQAGLRWRASGRIFLLAVDGHRLRAKPCTPLVPPQPDAVGLLEVDAELRRRG